MAKQVTIKIETSSLLIFRSRNSMRAWCPQCAAEGEMIVLENTPAISTLDQAALEQWLDSGDLHQSRAVDGPLLICLNSLLARVQNPQPGNRGIPRLPNTKPNTKKERT